MAIQYAGDQANALDRALDLLKIVKDAERGKARACIEGGVREIDDQIDQHKISPGAAESKKKMKEALECLALAPKILSGTHMEWPGTATEGDTDPDKRRNVLGPDRRALRSRLGSLNTVFEPVFWAVLRLPKHGAWLSPRAGS